MYGLAFKTSEIKKENQLSIYAKLKVNIISIKCHFIAENTLFKWQVIQPIK